MSETNIDYEKSFTLVNKWLKNSVYNDTLDKSSNYQGLIYAGYNWRLKKWTWLYSEITGYAISVYLCLYRWTGKAKCYSLAREAGNALLRFQCNKLNLLQFSAILEGDLTS